MHHHLRRRSLRLGLVTLAFAVACAEPSGSSSERREVAGEVAGEVAPREAPGRPVEVVAASVTCEAPPAPSTVSERARAAAVDAMLAGRPEQAALDFEALIRASPRDLGAQALAGAARELLAASQERVAALSDQIEPVRVEPLPRAARIVERLRLAGVDPVTLTISSAKANLITDDADWLARVGVEPPGRRVFRGRDGGTVLPRYVASALRGRPAQAIYTHADHVVSYARDVFGKKGFLSAIDLDQKALIWRSDPLVASWSFVIVDDLIVTGYGFTDEPDHLFVLWTETGEKLAQSPLDSAPSRIRAERRGEGALIRVTTYKSASYFDLTRGGGGRR
jgi:hypothetical protein